MKLQKSQEQDQTLVLRLFIVHNILVLICEDTQYTHFVTNLLLVLFRFLKFNFLQTKYDTQISLELPLTYYYEL